MLIHHHFSCSNLVILTGLSEGKQYGGSYATNPVRCSTRDIVRAYIIIKRDFVYRLVRLIEL